MREYRGLTYQGEWVYGAYLYEDGRHYIITKLNNRNTIAYGTRAEVTIYWVRGETVGQYTGMNDKHGDRIFEGDKVACNTEDIGIVEWDDDLLRYAVVIDNVQFDLGEFHDYEVEVIGTIHDNPDVHIPPQFKSEHPATIKTAYGGKIVPKIDEDEFDKGGAE